MRKRRGKTKGFDETYIEAIAEGIKRFIAAGMEPEEALAQAAEAAGTTLKNLAPTYAATLIQTSPRMLRQHRRMHQTFERHIRKHWGKPLDLYYSVLVCAEEMGREFDTRNSPESGEMGDDVFEVLTGLHARAVRTAAEVHAMLSGGFPLGALARCRTLHELAVTSIIIADFGRFESRRSCQALPRPPAHRADCRCRDLPIERRKARHGSIYRR